MCEGVVSDQPGDCPVCGMALERNPAWSPPADVRYTCPMHPEVDAAQPGSCPVCGMALEARAPAAEAAMGPEERDLRRRLWFSAPLALPVFLLGMSHLVPGLAHDSWLHGPVSRWLQLLLSTPVVLWGGWPFFRRGWNSLRHRSPNMFTLIMLGVGAAYLASLAALFFPGWFPAAVQQHGQVPVYFESAAVIIVLVLAGQVLEARARRRTGDALRALLTLAPPVARRLTPNGDEEIPVSQVTVGDRLRLVPGAAVPVDGIVLEGTSTVDESMLTGEAMPVEKQPGEAVSAGTLNGSGSLVIEARRVGRDTLLGQIVDLVAAAQRSRAPIQRVADRVAALFTPAVVLVAVLTFIIWLAAGPEPRFSHALSASVAVLIIACPCALGLATPMSLMVGLGRGAREGVLVRDAASLELLEKTTLLAIDKTGTLTEGRPRLLHVHATAGLTDDELLRRVAALEQHSEHPLAAAIQHAARARGLPLLEATNFTAFPGGGISGTVEDASLLVGSPAFLRSHGVSGLEELLPSAEKALERGETVIFAANQGQAAGWLALADTVKTTTPEALHHLHALGLQVVMVTGDQAPTAAAIARTLGLDHYHAEQTPADKAALVRRWQKEGQRVAMAGDGINDAPALAQADTGIAMGTGADVALQTAGLTLVKGDLRGLVKAFRLSRAIMRNIRQNLLFAYLYNSLGIPLAAGILYPFTGWLPGPMLAGLAMSFSSVSVIANALRLRRVKI